MADLLVVVPSRGRPAAAAELAQAFAETCAAATKLIVAIDESDSTYHDYLATGVAVAVLPTRSMVEALNTAARIAVVDEPFAIGFMGDDHRPRTIGWDKEYLDALRDLGTGIVYGNDLLQGEQLPTQCAMTCDIVRALGYMCPPALTHMYVDNFWLDLGREADCLYYLPDVVIEHMHPIAGKAEWDEGHRRVNDRAVYDADAEAYAAYHRSGRFWEDVDKVKALRSGS